MRNKREIIAINVESGEKRMYPDTIQAAADLGTSRQNVIQQLNRNGFCGSWKLYDSTDTLKKRIYKLEKLIKEVESL